ncbi:V-type ATP synthase subunit D [Ruminococcaceae bacterium OttesenSCG-928-L11]|nr:V-type ATP synthase subunit D [Ruminococcaceae bacterium OttesenSCG-928-L11]
MDGLTNVAPTKGNLLATKRSLALATMGYELMDKKRNILVREMMALIDKADALRGKIDETYSTAYEALQSANITLGICDSIAQSAPIEDGLVMSFRSVMGVELPTVRLKNTDIDVCYDFSSSNSAFDEAYLCFHNVKLMIAELAEIENSVFRLAVAIKKTQSRANALKNIIIPNQENDIRFITNALNEKEREEFSRLKVIKRNKG